MPVTCTSQERSLHAAISGDVDHHSTKAIMQSLLGEIDHCLPRHLEIDCAGISFMDSSGIALLLRCQKQMAILGGSMTVKSLPAQSAKVLRTAGLDRLITME